VFIDPSDVNTVVVTVKPFFANNPSSMAISPQWLVMSSTTPSLTWVTSGVGNAPVNPADADGEAEVLGCVLGGCAALLGEGATVDVAVGVDALPEQAANTSTVTIPKDSRAGGFAR
jgi:hypothetical protein